MHEKIMNIVRDLTQNESIRCRQEITAMRRKALNLDDFEEKQRKMGRKNMIDKLKDKLKPTEQPVVKDFSGEKHDVIAAD